MKNRITPNRAMLTTRRTASRIVIIRQTATMISWVVTGDTEYMRLFRYSACVTKYCRTTLTITIRAASTIHSQFFLYLSASGFIRNTTYRARHR